MPNKQTIIHFDCMCIHINHTTHTFNIIIDHLAAPVFCPQIIDENFITLVYLVYYDIIQRVPQKCASTAVKYSNFTAMGEILAI